MTDHHGESFGPYLYVVGEESYAFTERDIELGEQQIRENPRTAIGMKMNYIGSKRLRELLLAQLFDGYIDGASGVPMPPHLPLHVQVAPAMVLYNDQSAHIIAEAERRYGDAPNARFCLAKLEQIDDVLAAAAQCFGAARRLGVFLQAVVYFIDDTSLAYIAQRLFEWLAPGSWLVITGFPPFFGPAQAALLKKYADDGIVLNPRTVDDLLKLFPGWRIILHQQIEDTAKEADARIKVREDLLGTIGYALILERP